MVRQRFILLCPSCGWRGRQATERKPRLQDSRHVLRRNLILYEDVSVSVCVCVTCVCRHTCHDVQAVTILASKEQRDPQGEIICTRQAFEGEKSGKSQMRGAKSDPLHAGGLCFRSDGSSSASKVKPEDSSAGSGFLLHDVQPKHCSHLLK